MVHREYFNPQWFCSHKNPTDCSGQGAWYLFVVYVVYLVVNKVVASKSGQVDDDGVDHCAGTPHSPLAAPRRDVLHLERVIDEARAARAELKLHVTCSHEKGNGRSQRTVVSYRGVTTVATLACTDASDNKAEFVGMLRASPANMMEVDFSYEFEFDSARGRAAYEAAGQAYYDENKHRDDRVEVHSSLAMHTEAPQLFEKRHTVCGALLAATVLNTRALLASVVTTLIAPYMLLYAVLVARAHYRVVKVFTVDPQSKDLLDANRDHAGRDCAWARGSGKL